MLTKNERSMIIELAKSLTQITYALRMMSVEVSDIKRKEDVGSSLDSAGKNLEELISLMDKEWFKE